MSDHETLVSIVLPTYNRAHMLEPAAQSCLSQTWQNLELIIVDDGSVDDTPAVAARIAEADSRVRYVRQENGKLPRALNRGFAAARGEFYTWTSDDNFYEPDAIASMARFLMDNPDVGLVYCGMKLINEDDEIIGKSALRPPSTILSDNPVGGCFLYRASVAKIVGDYDPEGFLVEDYDYWLRIDQVARLEAMNDTYPYRYRLHPESLTERRVVEVELLAAELRSKYARGVLHRRRILADGFVRAATELRRARCFRRAFSLYVQALGLNPLQPRAIKGLFACGLRHMPRVGAPSRPA